MKPEHQQEPITLYSYVLSPFAAKVHCFLLYKGVRFDCFYVNPLHVERDLPLAYQIGLHSGDEVLDYPEIVSWMQRMGSHVSGGPPLLPAAVMKRGLP